MSRSVMQFFESDYSANALWALYRERVVSELEVGLLEFIRPKLREAALKAAEDLEGAVRTRFELERDCLALAVNLRINGEQVKP